MRSIALVFVLALAGCVSSTHGPGGYTVTPNLESGGPTTGNRYDLNNDAYLVDSTQPHSGSDISNDGMSYVIPGPANLQALRLTESVRLFTGNPAKSRMDELHLIFGEPQEDGSIPVSSLKILGYETDAPSAIIAEGQRLDSIVGFLSNATDAQKVAFIEAVIAQKELGLAGVEALTEAARIAFPGFTP